MITTINGDIKNAGKTYIHEHIKIDLSGHKKDPDTNFDDIDKVKKELALLKKTGIETLVDVTNIGMGRDIRAMLEVANETGLNIVASTGFYKEPFLPNFVYEKNDYELINMLIKDLEIGIDGTNSKAHVLGEVGTSHNVINPMEKRMMKIIAHVHNQTGKPVFTHTTLGTMALEQLHLLKGWGVNLEKVLVGHLDLSDDFDYHLRVAEKGCYLGFDTIGKWNYQTDETRIKIIKTLVERGHKDQIVLSQDLTRKSHLAENGGIGYGYLYNDFITKMLNSGISQDTINNFLSHNPSKLLNT